MVSGPKEVRGRGDTARSRAQSGMDVKLELDRERGQAMEVAGFVGWLGTLAALLLYLAWAFIPDAQLVAMGIEYYPTRYLAVAVPAWLAITFCCFMMYTTGMHLLATATPESYESLHDTASNELPDRTDWGSAGAMGTPELADYPITLVTRTLHPVPSEPAAIPAAPRGRSPGARDRVGRDPQGGGVIDAAGDEALPPTGSVGPSVSSSGWLDQY